VRLLITEKPSVAIDIARVLGGFARHDGYLEKDDMIISWAVGHLIELAMPQDYDPRYKKWDITHLPIIPNSFQLIAKSATRKQLNILKTLINRKDVTSLINGCDAGREGELIFRYITEYLNCRSKPHERLWLSETTDTAVINAFTALRTGSSMDNLADSAKARSQADWIVGINATRGYTVKHNDKITVGRVQTPTLALLVQRQEDIDNFAPIPYLEVHAEFLSGSNKYNGQYFKTVEGKAVTRLDTKAEAEAIVSNITGQPAVITEVSTQLVTQHPPQLYNLNELQKDANKKYGYTATDTLAVAQKLYEDKLITYPRTDSRYLTVDMAATLPDRLKSLHGTEVDSLLASATGDIVSNKRFTDNNKVSDHTAIIITEQPADSLLGKEKNIYWLIAKRTLAIFFPPAKYNKTKIITTVAGDTFATNAREVIDLGWRVVLNNESDDDDKLPTLSLTEGESAAVTGTEIKELQTKPPKLFTESDILTQMEKYGLGTPATRAGIIEKIISVGYAERVKKNLVPTTKGMAAIKDVVSPALADIELTAEWERKLEAIAQGQYSADEFMAEIQNFITDIINDVKNQEVIVMSETIGICPICKQPIIEGAKGYGCSGYKDGCKFVIWKEIAGKKITPAHVKQLLAEGITEEISGFKSKAGNTFNAQLVLGEDNKVGFKFAEREAIGTCPACGKEITEGKKGYGCSGYKDGCKFVIWKEIAGKKITLQQVEKLLTDGKTPLIKGFKSKAGKEFDAMLVIKDDQVGMEFPQREMA
jgi:DNA topoisomerase-3